MLIVKTVKTLFIPKVATIIKSVVFQVCATKAEIGGTDNSNGHSGFDAVKGHRIWETPFVAEELSKVFHGVDSFRGKHPIHGHNKRNKGAALFKTLLQTFLFLLIFGSLETFQRISVHISFGVQVLETNVKNSVCAAGEKAADKQITALSCGGLSGWKEFICKWSWGGRRRRWSGGKELILWCGRQGFRQKGICCIVLGVDVRGSRWERLGVDRVNINY